jgi:exopolysaccharide biosynthesis protein
MGCKVAYNLDGGQTAVMTYNGAVANQPYNGGRSVSDIVYITDEG